MILSLTRLRLKRWRYLPRFLKLSQACMDQAAADPACLGGVSFAGPGLAFWTATLWKDEKSLRAYMGSGAHREALPLLRVWCDEAASARLLGDRLPERREMAAWLSAKAQFTPVEEPSPLQKSQVMSSRHPWLSNRFKI